MGDKKIGVAVSDPLGMTAQGVVTLSRQTFQKDCERILTILEDYLAKKIIIGLPLDLRHEEGPQAKKVHFFKRGLEQFLTEEKYPAVIELFDESFSSREAEAILLTANLGRKKRKRVRDKLAATLILQNYLEQS